MESIPVFKPLLEAEESAASLDVLRVGWLGMGANVRDFEQALAALVGVGPERVVAVSTGHAALHLALMLRGVGPGDEVITPSFNNIADFQAILAVGATPVFADIDDATLSVDPAAVAKLIGPRTRAIISMDYGCHFADHERLLALGAERGVFVLHDAAHSIGGQHPLGPIGAFAPVTMFSFDPVKTFTCIDGGALVVSSEEETARLHRMRLIGMGQPASVMYNNTRAWTYDVGELGFRYHLANLHAAIGVAQLRKLDRIRSTRLAVFARYQAGFADLPGLKIPAIDPARVVPFLYYLRVLDGKREALREHLRSQGVDTGIHWQPGHAFTLFRECRRGPLDVTERVGREIVTIPLHSAMEDAAVERVIAAVRSFFGR